MYEDISEIGTVLWHNERLAIKVVCAGGFTPCLLLVNLEPTNEYAYFECELTEFSNMRVADVIKYVIENTDSIYESTLMAGNALCISADGNIWTFKKT